MSRTIRQFQLVEQLGVGSTGAVWRAVQGDDHAVALKELHPGLAKDEHFIRRFESQSKAASGLEHENIVRVLEYGLESEACFVAMELVEGIGLKQLVEREGLLPMTIVLTIALDVLAGLDHAHINGIVHQRIGPSTVLVASDGVAKLTDFSAGPDALPYRSPEQLQQLPQDQRTDIFSFAVVLFQLLAGSHPYADSSGTPTPERVVNLDPPSLRAVAEDVPMAISRVIQRAMAKNPKRRTPNVRTLLEDLRKACEASDVVPSRDVVARFVTGTAEEKESIRRHEANLTVTRNLRQFEERQRTIEAVSSPSMEGSVNDPPEEFAEDGMPSRLAIIIVVVLGVIAVGGGAYLGWRGIQKNRMRAQPTATVMGTPVAAGPNGSLNISSTPAAPFFIDGVFQGITKRGNLISIEPGAHTIRIQHPAHAPTLRQITVEPGGGHRLHVMLEDAPSGYLRLNVAKTKPARVFIDSFEMAKTPVPRHIELAAGKHTVTLRGSQCKTQQRNIEITRDKVLTVNFGGWCRSIND